MAIEVFEAPLAQRQSAALRGKHKKAYQDFLDQLNVLGCAALGYRLYGEGVLERICAKHLFGSTRVLVAFDASGSAWVLLIGPHDEGNQAVNIYDALYRLVGVDPPDISARTKPPCCAEEDGEPPVVADHELAGLASRVRDLRRIG